MVWIDYAIITIIGASCTVSLIRGFVREVLSLMTWICAFFITSQYYTYLLVCFTGFKYALVRKTIAIVMMFIITLIIRVIVNFVIGQLIKKINLSGIDKVFGICFGALRGMLIVAAAILFFFDNFTVFSTSEDWQKSKLIPQFSFIIKWFLTTYKAHRVFS